MADDWVNQLYFGDNLDVLREHIPDESVDLIYLDPPFNSNATYSMLFRERSGTESAAQITAFEDTWHWTIESERAYREVVTRGPEKLSKLLQAMRDFLGQSDMMAYLAMMAPRLAELRRALKPTGSIYLHCDPTASHHLKFLMDAVFGSDNFRNEIVWKRTSFHKTSKRFGRIHDVILFYAGSEDHTWRDMAQKYDDAYIRRNYRYSDDRGRYRVSDLTGPGVRQGDSGQPWRGVDPTEAKRHWAVPRDLLPEDAADDINALTTQEKLDLLDQAGLVHWPAEGRVPQRKRYLDEDDAQPVQDLWLDINPIGARARERLGYPTQKPEALLDRIIQASSNEGDVVLDPFCGCGTAVAVAERLKRRWIGIDVTHLAVSIMKHRLHNAFGDDLSDYTVVGLPQDVESALALAEESEYDGRYQFEHWALGLVDARPSGKKGADSGVDGSINFFDDNSGKAKRIIVQVKSGKVNRGQVATLIGDMKDQEAELGIFITLQKPTRPMRDLALGQGVYTPQHFPDHSYPRVQILTIEELLDGAQPEYPRFAAPATFKRASRRKRAQGSQPRLTE